MTHSLPSKPEVANPNRELIDGLREAADLLEQHPELPAFSGYILHSSYGKSAREEMTALARALGSRAVERPDRVSREWVEILTEFGTVRLSMSAPVRDLGGSSVPAHLSYAPILTGSES